MHNVEIFLVSKLDLEPFGLPLECFDSPLVIIEGGSLLGVWD